MRDESADPRHPPPRSPARLILPFTVFTAASFVASTIYAEHAAARVDDDAVSIATNASPSIVHLAAARDQLVLLQAAASSAVEQLTAGGPADVAPFDRARVRMREELDAYLQLPFYPAEHERWQVASLTVAALERKAATLARQLAARDSRAAVALAHDGFRRAVEQADVALGEIVRFDAEEEHRLGLEIPRLRDRAARIGYLLDGISAALALVLMGLVFRASRDYARTLDQARRAAELRAVEESRFTAKVESIADAATHVAGTLGRAGDVRVVFQAIADEARALAVADYAAVGIGSDPDRPFDPWVFSGVSPSLMETLGRPPRPVGLLGQVTREARPLRVDDVARHALFGGMPARHPPIGPFLGVAIRHRGDNVGNLYLARKRGAAPFSDEDERVAELLAGYVGVAVANARLYREAQAATRAREDLMAIVSHDLKSPLQAIRIAVELLERRAEDDRARELAKRIRRSSSRMARLIGDLLDAARIEAGLLHTTPSTEKAGALVEEAIESFRPLASEKSIELRARCPAADAAVRCDRERVLQLFGNLIGNAVKFSPEGGAITIAAEPAADAVAFSVADDGPGIADRDLPHIFDRYWQHNPGDRRGTGLGLFIAKGIASAHGGRIWAESILGHGTTIFFTLPIAQ